MDRLLAIDTGGSKTKAVVLDAEGTETECFELIGFGTAAESEEALPELDEFLEEIARKHTIASVAVNLGGKNKEQIRKTILKYFAGSVVSVYRESEGKTAAAFGRSCGANAVLLAGTGTIGIAYDDQGRYVIGGGWGMNIGDGGSGYDIGLEAVRRSLLALDGNQPLTRMQKEITGLEEPIGAEADPAVICGIRDRVRARIFPLERKRIASYSKVVAGYCEQGEEDALEIMEEAGRKMAYLMQECINKLRPYEVHTLAVSGGLVTCRQFWQESFEQILRQNSKVTQFIYEKDGILCGTKWIARDQYDKKER